MADNFNPTDLPVVPTATSTTAKGAYKALTPLQKQTDALGGAMPPEYSGATSKSKSEYAGETEQDIAIRTEANAALAAEANATPIKDAFKESFGGFVRDIYRASTAEEGSKEVDPSYDVGSVRQNFRSTYGAEHWDELERTRNKSQYDALVTNLEAKAKHDAVLGGSLAGTLVGSLFDPIGLLTGSVVLKGGMQAAKAFKLSKTAALAGGAAVEGGIYAGIEAGVQKAEFGEVYNPTQVAQTFAIAAALHFGIGAIATPKSAFSPAVVLEEQVGTKLVAEARTELAAIGQRKSEELDTVEYKPEEPRIFPDHTYPDPKPDELIPEDAIADAGSAANKTRADATAEVVIKSDSDKINDNIESSRIADKANKDAVGQKTYDWLDSKIGTVSAKFSNTLQGLKSKSEVVRTHALILGADPTGLFRAVEHGTAYDKRSYNELIRNHHANVHDDYRAWLKRTGQGGYVAAATGKNEIAFNKALRAEMEARWNTKDLSLAEQKQLDEARWQTVAPEIKRSADSLDAGNQAALDLMKKYNVLGAEGLNPISRGYVSRRMDGDALRNLFSKSPKEFANLQSAFGRRYYESFKGMQDKLIAEIKADTTLTPEARAVELKRIRPITPDKAQTIATGVMERAINKSAGVDGTTVGLLDRAARDEIKAILESKLGKDAYVDIEHTFNLLDKRLGSKSGSNRLKGRMEIDIATPDKDSGLSFMDYFDNDLNKLTSSYSEEMSGRIALARQGISTDNDFENIIQAAKNSHTGTAEEVADDIQLLRDMYAQLLGRPLDGQGRSKAINFLTNLNPLQTLGQVGVAQATESSLSVARLGVGAALKALPMFAKVLVGARKGLVSADDKVLLKDIEAWVGPVGEAWRTHRPLTEVMERLNANGEVAHMADRLLKAGQHINGFVSMMHQVMETQLKIVAIQGSRTFAKEIKAGVLTKRIADAGFTKESMAAIKRELDTHAVFKNGELHDMQLGKWSHDNADHFTRNIQRLSGQLIQNDFAGETASWMHKDMGRMLLSLRGYSIKAYNKQLVRNVAMHDAVAAQSLVYGLAFSTLGYTAKTYAVAQMREDKEQFLEDRLSGNAFIQGAVGYMALGAFGPELIRPLLSWNEEAGEAGAIKSGGNAIVALIPGLSPLNRLMQDVDAIGSSALGDTPYTSKKVRHLVQSTLGNSFPVAFAVNAMVDDDE